tara:strand:- start:837 stop:1130 length:294 start_codon:yes stop_codon:yes gene_type:complete
MLSGDRFLYNSREYMKLEIEVIGFARPDQETNLRMNIDNEEGLHAVGRMSIIFNAVDVLSGALVSLQSEDAVEPMLASKADKNVVKEEVQTDFDFDF